MRKVKPIEFVFTNGQSKACSSQGYRMLDDWLKMKADPDTYAYVVQLAEPAGWGVCFIREGGDILKEYSDKDTARVAARISV